MCAELEASEGVNLDEVAEDRVRTNGPDPQDKDACWTERGKSDLSRERQAIIDPSLIFVEPSKAIQATKNCV